MLKQRILTALILIPFTLALLVYLPPAGFCIVTLLMTLAAAGEWSNLMGVKRVSRRILYVGIILFLMIDALFIPAPVILAIAFIWWLWATVAVLRYPRGSQGWGRSVLLRGLMGVFVLIPCWVAINYIRMQSDGVFDLLFLFLLIWGADSVAYFVGKKWGKTKLAPEVSPGKSVQGFAAAMLSAIGIAAAALAFWKVPLPIWPWVIALAMVTVLFSVVGDLCESMLKRQAGLKDSGSLLPGHGGLLDRIDSLTAAAPIFALGAILLGVFLG
ncbi:MAG: phosphatidate cytidylyltransferase [Gammaproteobacteria bacterium]|nr:MAG: phosphatidate cytidylyltransferase [Gammaproteobacteria bacterium]